MFKYVAVLALLASSAIGQEAPKLTEVETLQLKLTILEGKLVQSQLENVRLNQQITLAGIKAAHKWGPEVQFTLAPDGTPTVK